MYRSWVGAIVIDCDDLDACVAFWSAALGAGVAHRDDPYVFLDPLPGGLRVGLQRVPEPKTAKSRVHLDIASEDIAAEAARLEALGARRRAYVEHWWVLEDPCGNEFCVIGGRAEEAPAGARTWAREP